MKHKKLEINENTTKNHLPEKKFSAGAVKTTVWNNVTTDDKGNQVEYKTISFDRSYKDKNGQWKTTNSLRINDLPKAVIVLNKAYEYLILKEQGTNELPEDSFN